jgi:hypothetical protein
VSAGARREARTAVDGVGRIECLSSLSASREGALEAMLRGITDGHEEHRGVQDYREYKRGCNSDRL